MASIVAREVSPFFYLSFQKADGSWGKRKLPIRRDDPDAKRKLAMVLADEQVREANRLPMGKLQLRGWSWVPAFLEEKYRNEKTRLRARNAWAPFSVYLEAQKLTEPGLVKYAHGLDYVKWRQDPPKGSGVKARSRNTAILELKFASQVMQHAVRLELALANPLFRMGLKKTPPKEKVEITREEQARIQAALADKPEWMRDAWDVAMKLGNRLRAAQCLMSDINEAEMTILLPEQKGKRHLAPLHPDLLPLVRRRREEGARYLVEMPAVTGPKWRRFFDSLGMRHHCFHDTRVTVITRLARAGVSETQNMQYVGHSSTAVHAVYRKLKAPDVAHLGKML